MNKASTTVLRLLCLALCLACLLAPATALAAPKAKVLILHSYHQEWEWDSDIQEAIREQVDFSSVELYTEYMDCYRKYTESTFSDFFHYLNTKYAGERFDAIFVSDNYAYDFITAYHRVFSPDTPVVMVGVNNFYAPSDSLKGHLTGVAQNNDIVAMLDTIRALQKDVHTVLVCGANSSTAKEMVKYITNAAEKNHPDLRVVGMIQNSVEAQLAALDAYDPKTSAIICEGANKDADGNILGLSEYASQLADKPGFRVYATAKTYIAGNVIGGNVIRIREHTRIAWGMVEQILQGKPVSELPVISEPVTSNVFNYPALQPHGITVSMLPADSEILNSPSNLITFDRNIAIAVGMVLLLMTLLLAALLVNISRRKAAERVLLASSESLHREKEHLRITLQSIGDGVIATDREGRVTMVNQIAQMMTGWPAEEAQGRPLTEVFDIYNEQSGQVVINPVSQVLSTGEIVDLANHTMLRSRQGTLRHIADSAAPIMDTARHILGVVLVFRDVTEQKRREKEIKYLSYHDQLTGLYNRTFFEEELHRLDSPRQLPMSLIMGDVNGLKLTNDVFGHTEGDRLLIAIANLLRECCRAEDLLARTGGDEFCILLPRTDAEAVQRVCARIYELGAQRELQLGGRPAHMSISLGFATKESPHQEIHNVLKQAEDYMYKRKLLESRSLRSSILSSFKSTLYEKSHETEEHAMRLVEHTRRIGRALHLTEEQMGDLEMLAMLHDIGKIAVDDSILAKPGALSEEEWVEMRKHTEVGYRIALASPELMHIADSILGHHERWDGKGYPQGLSGESIPILARILSVADSYDAMTNDRVYRKAISHEQAVMELLQGSGKQFDPQAVEGFMQDEDDIAGGMAG